MLPVWRMEHGRIAFLPRRYENITPVFGRYGMGLDVLNALAITVIAVVALFMFSKLGKGGC